LLLCPNYPLNGGLHGPKPVWPEVAKMELFSLSLSLSPPKIFVSQMFIVLRTEMLYAWEEQVLQHNFITDNLSQIMNEKQFSHFNSFRNSNQMKIVTEHKPTKCTLFKLILSFNFLCLLHVSNLMGSSSGRLLYAQCLYGMFYVHWCKDEPMRFKTCRRHQKLI
jgi:hypothetical protein